MKKKMAEQAVRFNELFRQLVSAMTQLDEINIPMIDSLLVELCAFFRLSRAETYLYNSLEDEKQGKGERLSCYDTGEGEPVASVRIVSSILTVGTTTVYMEPGVRPLSDEERTMLELVMRTVLYFLSRKRFKEVVEKLAFCDDAGYRNIRSLQNYNRKVFVEGRRCSLATVRYNLRHFSMLNRDLGRKAADAALWNHYKLIEEKAGKDGIVCRMDGDNFVAICRREHLDALLACLEEANVLYDEREGKTVSISANAGVYIIPDNYTYIFHDEDIRNRVYHSYLAAMSGKQDHIVFYDDTLAHRRDKIVRAQQAFPEALRKNEFFTVYQPKVNFRTGKITGAEALCRWQHDGELVFPGDFIPALEETNDICSLDFYMLANVCRDIRRWLDEGRDVVRISVNLSRKHMMNRNLLQEVREIIDGFKVPHQYLEFECTETTTDVESGVLHRIVNGMQKMGISMAVDDYGVGYSSLNLLRGIPWNAVKIDRSILPVNAAEPDSRQLSVVLKHVLAMIKEIGMECVVEGVETQYQLDLLREMDCDVVQGFYFDRPLRVEDFEKRMQANY